MLKFVAMTKRKPTRRYNYSSGGIFEHGGAHLDVPTIDTSTSYNPTGTPGGGMFADSGSGGDSGQFLEGLGQGVGGILDFFRGEKTLKMLVIS